MSTQKTILVVEDDHILLQALDRVLTMHEFAVIPCLTGKQALDSLTKTFKVPDAICLDYYLPDMNGAEFMAILNKNEIWKDIPVVILSNSDEEESERSTLALGAKIYMLKTQYQLDDVVTQLEKLLSTEG